MMDFKPKYIEICRKLPPRKPEDWQMGDWVYYSVDNRPAGPCLVYDTLTTNDEHGMVSVDIHAHTGRIGAVDFVHGKWDSMQPKEYENLTEPVWLPSSPVDWMQMKGWPGVRSLQYSGGWWYIEEIRPASGELTEITEDSDPLLACALAYEKAVNQ